MYTLVHFHDSRVLVNYLSCFKKCWCEITQSTDPWNVDWMFLTGDGASDSASSSPTQTPTPSPGPGQEVSSHLQQLCTCVTLSCTFLNRHCTANTTWQMPYFTFYRGRNKRRRIFLSLSKLECGPQEINSREIHLHLTFLANWNKFVKFEKK